jgi:hypothetical protein
VPASAALSRCPGPLPARRKTRAPTRARVRDHRSGGSVLVSQPGQQ